MSLRLVDLPDKVLIATMQAVQRDSVKRQLRSKLS